MFKEFPRFRLGATLSLTLSVLIIVIVLLLWLAAQTDIRLGNAELEDWEYKNNFLKKPDNVTRSISIPKPVFSAKKKILLWEKSLYGITTEEFGFCPHKCDYTDQRTNENLMDSDAIVIGPYDELPPIRRDPTQRWVFYFTESPQIKSPELGRFKNAFNWTMTYRADSDIPAFNGGLLRKNKTIFFQRLFSNTDFLTNRKQIAWIPPCFTPTNAGRTASLLRALRRLVKVDTFGKCGDFRCPDDSDTESCMEFLGQNYKYYLSLEDSVCEDYITSTFFLPLKYNMIPIASGPYRWDYQNIVAADSFIHLLDFSNLIDFATHLRILDLRPVRYLRMFRWRMRYDLDDVDPTLRHLCSLCTKLNKKEAMKERKIYMDINKWWYRSHFDFKHTCRTAHVWNVTIKMSENKINPWESSH